MLMVLIILKTDQITPSIQELSDPFAVKLTRLCTISCQLKNVMLLFPKLIGAGDQSSNQLFWFGPYIFLINYRYIICIDAITNSA